MRLTPLVLLLSSCMFVLPCPECEEPVKCHDVAIRDAAGAPDPCDVAACSQCVESCGGDCAIQESYPPTYACSDGSWSVYDECPAWEPPASGPNATAVQELGCGEPGEELLTATSSAPGRIDVVHNDYLLGCCPDSVRVDVATTGRTLAVDYTLIDDVCDCACMLDASYAIVDVPAGTWTLESKDSNASATVTVP